jgi:hypothetical protein
MAYVELEHGSERALRPAGELAGRLLLRSQEWRFRPVDFLVSDARVADALR